MAKANPPPFFKIPKKWLADKELRAYLQNRDFIQFQLWKKIGGGSDAIEDIESVSEALSQIDYSEDFNALEQIEDLIPIVDKNFYSAIKKTNYTAVDGDFIEAQSSAIITLDPNASLNDQIVVANGDGTSIKVVGTIKYKRLDTSLFIKNQGTSLHFQYFGDYWRVR